MSQLRTQFTTPCSFLPVAGSFTNSPLTSLKDEPTPFSHDTFSIKFFCISIFLRLSTMMTNSPLFSILVKIATSSAIEHRTRSMQVPQNTQPFSPSLNKAIPYVQNATKNTNTAYTHGAVLIRDRYISCLALTLPSAGQAR